MSKTVSLIAMLLASSIVCAQQQQVIPTASSVVIVLGSPFPVSPQESARTVVDLDTQKAPLVFHQLEDYLRTDASVDIQQRGGAGIMSDISVRGASFEQTLVLVNGLRFDSAETSHFNLDLPIPLLAIGRVDVLHGEGSTLYGSDAIGGVVDVRTVEPTETSLRFKTGFGSFGENEQAIVAAVARRSWDDIAGADREFSTGFMPDRDYRSEDASDELRFTTAMGKSDLLLAGDDRSFGANQFYGPYVSWERTKGWFGALTQQFNPHTQASFAYRRHSDIFLLDRDEPTGYKNQHVDSGFEGTLRDQHSIGKDLTLASGLEEDTDQISSTNLGRHGRNHGAGYAALEWLKPGHGSISLGAREELFDGGAAVFSPMLSATHWVSSSMTLHGSIGHGFRIPTYLDLYYSDPATVGNPSLKPESAWNFEGGMNWFPVSKITANLTVFYSKQHDTIDYTRAFAGDPWKAANLPGVRFTGVEVSSEWRPSSSRSLRMDWTLLMGAQDALHGLQSKYVFNYPVNNARLTWTETVGQVVLNTRMGVLQRFQQAPYVVWDIGLQRRSGWARPYLQTTNLTNTGYQEIVGVRMPGRAAMGGIEFVFTGTRR